MKGHMASAVCWAAWTICVGVSAAADDVPRVSVMPTESFNIDRSQIPSSSVPAGSIVYSETSKGFEATFLETRFFHSPLLAADVDVGPEEPLISATIDGAPWLCTTRTIGRGSNSFICLGDTNGDGAVDQWRRVLANPRAAYASPDDLNPLDPDPMKQPINIRKGRAEPLSGREAVLEIRYIGVKDGNVIFRSSIRFAAEQTPIKEVETPAPLSATGSTKVEVKHPLGDRAILGFADFFLAGNSPKMRKALEGEAKERKREVATLEVVRADEKSVTLALQKPFLDWRYWTSLDEKGSKVEHTVWGRSPEEQERDAVIRELKRRAKQQ